MDNLTFPEGEAHQHTLLPNGIQVVTERMSHAHSVALGIWVRSGPRYEHAEQAGISHFIEHMLFKGTRHRTARQINESLYPVGGQLNAFTDREYTCYTALVLKEHVPLAMEVLADMLTDSLFAPEELDREKNVILEEIRAIEDTPEDLVHDLFASTIWPDHPLGRPVIGERETVAALTRDQVMSYFAGHYGADRLLVAAAGNLEHDDIVAHAEEYFSGVKGSHARDPDGHPHAHATSTLVYRKTEQAHFCLGMPSFRQADEDNYPLIVLDTVLGGGPHSRLFNEIRENQGLAYSVGSAVNTYREAGLFTVYASTSPDNLRRVLQIIREELERITDQGLSEEEIETARRHIQASMLLSHETTGARMGRIANSYLYFDRLVSFEEVIRKLESVTPEDVLRVARQVLPREASALAVIGPIRPDSRQASLLRAA